MLKAIKNKRNTKKFNLLLFFILFILMLIGSFKGVGLDPDSLNYEYAFNHFNNFFDSNFMDKEPTFWLILEINKYLFNSIHGVFLIYILIQLILLYLSIQKMSLFPLLSLFIYIGLYFIIFGLTQIRFGAAAGVMLYSIVNIVNREPIKYYIKVILAVLFHYSAIILVFLYFLNPKKINIKIYALLPLIGITFSYLTTSSIDNILEFARELPDIFSFKLIRAIKDSKEISGYNLFNFKLLINLVIYYTLLFNIKVFKMKSVYNIILFKIFAWSIFVYTALNFLPSISFRISSFLETVLIILLANFIFIFKEKDIVGIVILLYTLLIVIQTLFIKNVLSL